MLKSGFNTTALMPENTSEFLKGHNPKGGTMTAKRNVVLSLLVMSIIITACGQQIPSVIPTGPLGQEPTATSVPIATMVPAPTPEPTCMGHRIAYVLYTVTDVVLPKSLWVMCEDGTGQRQLVADPGIWDYRYLQWSPDSEQIFFQSEGKEGVRWEAVNADGTGRRAISRYYNTSPSSPEDYILAVSAMLLPDGEHIIYSKAGGGIYLANPDGEEERLLVSNAFYLQVSPDGKRVLFLRADPSREGAYALYIINMDGSGERQLREGMPFGRAFWSPDGELIAFVELSALFSDLYVISASGGDILRLTYGMEVFPYDVSWFWNSRQIAFTVGFTRPVIYMVDADGASSPKFVALGRNPVCSPSGPTIVYQNWDDDLSSWTLYSVRQWGQEDPVRLVDVPKASLWEQTWSPNN